MSGDRELTDKARYVEYYDDEIDLYELWLVLKKRKFYVFSVIILFVLLGGIYAFVSPTIYRSSAVVALPSMDVKERGRNVLVDYSTTEKIVESLNRKIEDKDYKSLPDSVKIPVLKAHVSKIDAKSLGRRGGKEVFLLEVEGKKKEILPQVINSVVDYLNDNSFVRKIIEGQKSLLKKQLNALEKEIPRVEREREILKKKFLGSKDMKVFGFNPMEIDKSVIELKAELSRLKYLLSAGVHGYEVVYVDFPDKPVKPKRKLILSVSFVTGLFLGVFVAFFVEWLENARKRFSGAPQR